MGIIEECMNIVDSIIQGYQYQYETFRSILIIMFLTLSWFKNEIRLVLLFNR